MIINRIILENYGLFSGRNEFDLRPNKPKPGPKTPRPIVLFGGKNGAGKTTFLGAMRLLLYGKKSFETKISQTEYEATLIGHLHRNKHAATRAPFAKIALEFEHALNGSINTFFVERSWNLLSDKTVKEFFRVLKDGEPFEDVSTEHLESFVADIIPARLSQLFFFDGEKIKSIAEDLSSNAAIAEAIHSLLGLDHVLSLKADLKVYRSRLIKSSKNSPQIDELEALEAQTSDQLKVSESLATDLASLETKRDGILTGLKNLEANIDSKGGSFAAERKVNEENAKVLAQRIDTAKQRIRILADSPLYFALAPNIASRLVGQIQDEVEARKSLATQDTVKQLKEHLLKQPKAKKAPTDQVYTFIEKGFASFLDSLSGQQQLPIVHNLGDLRGFEFIDTLTSKTLHARDSFLEACNEFEDLEQQLSDITRDLEKAPPEEDLSDLLEKLKIQNQALGKIDQEIHAIQEERRKCENEVERLGRRKEDLENAQASLSQEQNKLAYLSKLGPALDAYKKRLTKAKIETLREEVSECFNRLARKSDFVSGIDIDPETFAVNLLDTQGRSIPREDLSSGEKQIFAIAMLWGLARTSGRSLPVVIDTPLGRLDSDHRRKLVQEYFPNASHQVILLSTDTEVDQGLYEQLQPKISECYHLSYNHRKGHTETKTGYFWKETPPIKKARLKSPA